ncbi:transcription antiterminator [Streptococcus suis]|uniref:BglG family transcription antiterminator n=1 Tax=Streptococcus suis TaxID=1307 RepID=UPI001A98AD5E|nr:transcription antiterminator [Streptococcus suis]QTA56765.1 transcription antiterminator [Streptococcus suis]
MLLDKSSCALLRHLIGIQEPETIMAISKGLQQSRRKIYYHLEKINAAFPDHVEPIESLPRIGIRLSEEQKQACRQLLDSIDSYSYIMNMDERMQLMLLYICIAHERITLEKLMDLTEVSRNTVLNDLNEIRSRLSKEQYQMTLYVSKSQGYDLACHPLTKIQYIHSLLYSLFTEASKSFVSILEDKVSLFSGCQSLFSKDLAQFLSHQVYGIEKDLGKKINRSEIELMLKILPYMLLTYRNMSLEQEEKDAIVREFALVYERIEYGVAQKISQSLEEQFGLDLDEIEVSLIAVLLLSYRKDRDAHVTSQDFADLKKIVDVFIRHFELHSDFELEKKEELAHDLLAHCKAMLFRKTYGILSRNPLVDQIRYKYDTLFRLTKSSSHILEEAWQIQLTDEDIAYLTVHLGGALRRSSSRKLTSPTVFLICDEGVSVQKLLMKQCQHHLPEKTISAVFTTEQFKSVEDLLEVDFLISTNEVTDTDLPVIQVHPILDFDDVLRLIHFAKYRNLTDSQKGFAIELDKLLASYVENGQEALELKQRLQNLIANELLASLASSDLETDLY